ncbi:hypothetical protein KBY19_09695, partial [Streptomyces sp. B15]|nr:hypothetical protein [Streptomyces sp. B15]
MAANDLPNLGIPARLAARMSMAEQHAYLREKLTRAPRSTGRSGPTRRGVLRGGGLMVAGAAGAAGLVVGSDAALDHGPGDPAGAGAGLPGPHREPARPGAGVLRREGGGGRAAGAERAPGGDGRGEPRA